MTDAARRLIDGVIEREGGYVDDPDDPGGETKFGISKRSYPHVDIKSLTEDQAAHIYYTDFYLAAGLDKVPEPHAEPVLDLAVHSGIRQAVRLAQQVLKVPADGILGPQTVKAFHGINHLTFRRRFVLERLLFYLTLILAKPVRVKYARGWFRRALELT